MNIKCEHETLMNEWKRNRSQYENFVTDGILNYEVYYSSKPKIAVLLKESNGDFIDIAPITHKGYGPDGNSHLFWRHINIFIDVATAAWDNQQMSYNLTLRLSFALTAKNYLFGYMLSRAQSYLLRMGRWNIR